jgi:hypothetical protein
LEKRAPWKYIENIIYIIFFPTKYARDKFLLHHREANFSIAWVDFREWRSTDQSNEFKYLQKVIQFS